ncbi:hypothetical protein GT347_09760 [Xylophilus rhododendri]|uniref:Uncharacterized protein n=1 Tax=Xylophilus rhododendri TaxID=2697032 RepID=A0A857J5Y8_9BURK|nr:hypothetical protein [Xylophilus rhododendri]QHI98255.1 hypothetical protein GT347_09760 [Xylophilus rhododendri]
MTAPSPPPPPSADSGTDLDALDGGLARSTASQRAAGGLRGNAVRATQLLIAFVCLALICLNGWLVSVARGYETAQISQANGNLARSVAQQVDSALSDVEHVLDDTVFDLESAELSPQALERLQPTLVNKVARVEQLQGLYVFGADGRWLVTSEALSNEGRNNADRDYFIHHRDDPAPPAGWARRSRAAPRANG